MNPLFDRLAGRDVDVAQVKILAAPAVIMSSPPELEHNEQFVALTKIFGRAGIPVPEIVASHKDHGWYLMTDLGSGDLESAYTTSQHDAALKAAIDTLLQIQQIEDPAIPLYSTSRFTDELAIFSEWFLDRRLQKAVPAAIEAPFQALVNNTRNQAQCCVHRDYHCRNLLYNDGQLGIVDFQDALVGPLSYDLASLLYDCYHKFSNQDVVRWRDYYLSQAPSQLDPISFSRDLEFSAVQRQLKAVGIFSRLDLRDRKPSHLPYIEPVLRQTHDLCMKHAALEPLAEWLGDVVLMATGSISR